MTKLTVNSLGEASEWEAKAEGCPLVYPDGSKLWYAEVIYQGTKITCYFDVSPEEAKDSEAVKQWVIESDWEFVK